MKRVFFFCAAVVIGGIVLPALSLPLLAQESAGGAPSTIVTLDPKGKTEIAAPVPQSAVKVKVNGKKAEVSGWNAFTAKGTQPNLQLVLLLDDGARSSLGLHLQELEHFLTNQPPTTEVTLGYMRNGTAMLVGPFTTDHAKVADELRLPISAPGVNGSPYFSLRDLLQKWPPHAPEERREVVMVSDGVDRYNGLRYDPSNPYLDAAVRDAIRNRVVVYAIYYHNAGFVDRLGVAINSGQNYLTQMCSELGGEFFYQGFGNPVDFTPYLNEIDRKLGNQYELTVTPPPGAKNIANLKVQVSAPNLKVQAPQQIFVGGDGK